MVVLTPYPRPDPLSPSKKKPGETRAKPLRSRLTDAERAELDRAAAEKGLDTSAWARSGLLTLARSGGRSRDRGLEKTPPAH